MKTNLNFSQFFNPPNAWDSLISTTQDDPIQKFNELNLNTKFDYTLNSNSLNQFFMELIFHIKEGNALKIDNLVFGFMPILLDMSGKNDFQDSSFFQISKVMFDSIYKRNKKYSSILKIVSLYDIFCSNLPISISLGHLFHIQEKQAKLIHKYLYDGNTNSLAVKCLAISLALPSARFNELHPDYSSYCDMLNSIDYKKVRYFPDPYVILKKSNYFTYADLIYACFVVQYSNSFIFSLGLDRHNYFKNSNNNENSFIGLDLMKCNIFQLLITNSELTLGSLCHAIYILTTQPSTLDIFHHFFCALDNCCGIELLKELILLNTTLSFKKLMKSPNNNIFFNIFKQIDSENSKNNANSHPTINKHFLNIVKPFHPDIKNLSEVISDLVEMARVDEDKQKILPFLGVFHSVLLWFLINEPSNTYQFFIEHYNGITFVIHTFFEMLTLQPQFDKFEVTHLIACTIRLIYKFITRYQIKSLSSNFISETFECVYYLIHLPIEFVSFLLFEIQEVHEEIKIFVANHEKILNSYMVELMPSFLLPAASVITSYFDHQELIDPSIMISIVKYSIFSFVPQIFNAARNSISTFCERSSSSAISTFSKKLFDLYFTFMIQTEIHGNGGGFLLNPEINRPKFDDDDVHRAQTIFLLFVYEALSANEEIVQNFLRHPAFKYFYNDAQRQFETMPAPYTTLLCPLVAIFNVIWRGSGREFKIAEIEISDQKRPQKVDDVKLAEVKEEVQGEDSTAALAEVKKEEEVIVLEDSSDTPDSDVVEIKKEMICEVKNETSSDFYIPDIDSLLMNIQFLWAPTATSLLSLALSVAEYVGTFPYAVVPAQVAASPAENSADFLRRLGGFLPGTQDQADLQAAQKKANAPPQPDAGMPGLGLPWCAHSYEYDFIVAQKPVAVYVKSITLPNSQIIEDDYEEEEEEETKEDESSEF
ncbi:hypothetical protein M9Y10_027017 [Tritrichomonas musculus]|uniref:FPL domain-containing protein n=1 Tax=Tritrichomonas musculus TaxID=1915356 RepID=A0ABR2H7N7_9EUKA